MKNCYLFLLLILFAFLEVKAQDVIAASGRSTENSTVHINWTLGEAFVNSYQTSSVHLGEGFNQSSSSQVSSLVQVENESFSVYPNPFSASVFIELAIMNDDWDYEVLDLLGRTIRKGTISTKLSRLNLDELSGGTYLLQIRNSEATKTQVYKLIKH